MRQSMSALCSWLEREKEKVELPDSCLFSSLFNNSFYWSCFMPLGVYHLCMLLSSVVSLGLTWIRPVCDSVTVFLHFGLSCSILYFVSWLLTWDFPVLFGYQVLNWPFNRILFQDLVSQCLELVQSPSLHLCKDRIFSYASVLIRILSQTLPATSLCSLYFNVH